MSSNTTNSTKNIKYLEVAMETTKVNLFEACFPETCQWEASSNENHVVLGVAVPNNALSYLILISRHLRAPSWSEGLIRMCKFAIWSRRTISSSFSFPFILLFKLDSQLPKFFLFAFLKAL